MEICERGQIFIETDQDPTFDHTKLILRGPNDEYFYAKSNERRFPSLQIDPNTVETIKIPTNIWPLVTPELTQAPDPPPATAYLKRHSLLFYEATSGSSDYALQILTEVEACEILRKHPHPNIAPYWGCVVRDGRIRELCFPRYGVTLAQMLKDGTQFDKSACLSGIEAGVAHMHRLGLVHNDLNPSNIMMDGDCPVIIDFDSCKPEGEKLGPKGGSDGWALGGDYARRANDLYSIEKIRQVLLDN